MEFFHHLLRKIDLGYFIDPIVEAEFLDSRFVYRPGKNAKQAIDWVEEVRDEEHEWVVDAAAERISDGRVLRLIRYFLKADIMEQGLGQAKNVIGTPQSGVISPLLANIYLHYFDERMAGFGYVVV